jgi:uncharacterized RDD family membrane protein YckC
VLDYTMIWVLTFAYTRYFGTPTEEGGYHVQGCVHVFALFAIWALALPIPEGVAGRTFGKWACSLRVTNLSGRSVTLGQAFMRRFLDPIDLMVAFGLVAFIVAKTNPLSQRLGDLVAKTLVVEDSGGNLAA